MINEAITFLVSQLNEYLTPRTLLTNVVLQKRLVNYQGHEVHDENKVICQLVNIEEERVGKAQVPVAQTGSGGFVVRNPELRVNLSLMFTAVCKENSEDEKSDEDEYKDSIKLLAFVIQFFQHKHYFTPENSPSIPNGIENLVVELYPISLENQNYLWSALGVKYRPSVVYKVRLITILDSSFSAVSGPVTSITITNP